MSDTESPPAPVVSGHPVEVVEGVHVIPDGRVPLVPNVGIAKGDGHALVVDTAMGPRNAERVLGHVRSVVGASALTLTITHFHPEHGFGAQVFAPTARIVYNTAQRDELHAKGAAYLALFRTFGDAVAAELDGVELVDPDETYEGEATIDVGGIDVRLLEHGGGHTLGDQVVWLPERRVLFAGDLVENGICPIFPYFPPDDADVSGVRWIQVLERLDALGADVVVPGHGEVGDAGLIAAARGYLVHMRDAVRAALADGLDSDTAVAELEPQIRERYRDWEQPEWIAFGIRAFHDELSRQA